MSSRFFSILIFLGSLAGLASWLLILFYTDPTQSGFLIFSLFYLSLFLLVSGLLFIVGNFLRHRLVRKQLFLTRLRTALRQAIFFGILIIGWLMLQSKGLAKWWVILLFILVLTMMEFFFISFQKNNSFYEG